jgi:nitroreductase
MNHAESPNPTAPRSAAEAASTRRSVRRYSDTPVADDTLRTLLTLTGRAPSAHNLQPWRFVVVRDPALKAALGAAAYNQPQVSGAPVVLVLYTDFEDTLAHLDEVVHPGLPADKREATIAMLQKRFGDMPLEVRGTWANAQTNIALGYLLLLAAAEGLDSSPMLGFEADKVKALLDLPAQATITALVAIGYGAEDGFPSHRHAVDRIATFR